MMQTIALLGLGAMGTRVAQNLLQAGYPLVVYNRTVDRAQALEAQGATVAPTPRTAAAQADVVMSMVTDDDASRSVWLDANTGALHSLKAGKIAIASSTLTVGWTQALAAQIQPTGAAFLDAPVVGSRPQAEAGKLIYLVGGDPEILAQVRPVLSTCGSVQAIGEIGQGMAMKLAVNVLFGIQVAALGEILGLLQRQGMTASQAMTCLGNTPVLSPATQGAGSLMVANQHAPLFPTQLAAKDLRYALAAAQSAGTELPMTIATQQVFRQAIDQGYGVQNLTAVAQLYEQLGVSAAS